MFLITRSTASGWAGNAGVYEGNNNSISGQGIAQFNAIPSIPSENVVKNNIVYGNSQGDICGLGWKQEGIRKVAIPVTVKETLLAITEDHRQEVILDSVTRI